MIFGIFSNETVWRWLSEVQETNPQQWPFYADYYGWNKEKVYYSLEEIGRKHARRYAPHHWPCIPAHIVKQKIRAIERRILTKQEQDRYLEAFHFRSRLVRLLAHEDTHAT